jgi:hypothetical protein
MQMCLGFRKLIREDSQAVRRNEKRGQDGGP